MAGTVEGGLKASQSNKQRYDAIYLKRFGMTFYQYQGSRGGRLGRTGGFASEKRGTDGLTGRERARRAGAVGGRISRRGKKVEV